MMNFQKIVNQETNYYMVIMNPKLHRKTFNAIKLFLEVAEAKYVIYVDEEISKMELHELSKDEFKSYNYNPN